MLKIAIICCALFGLGMAFRHVPTRGNNIKSDLSFKALSPLELKRFLKLHPNAIELKPEPRNITDPLDLETKNRFFYTYGLRTCEEDILAIDWMEVRSLYPQNVTSTSIYPRDGKGGLVTFVLLQLDISDFQRFSVYITDGGIGQNKISFLISAYEVTEFGWSVNIYGEALEEEYTRRFLR